MSDGKKPVVDMRWLAEGRKDDFADYLNRSRENLPMADFSDDELGNAAFMNYDREREVEAAMMVKHHEEKTLHLFHSRIAIMTAVKERLRWLSRRVAVLEGRYPGVPSPANKLDEINRVCKERSLILEISYEHAKGGWWSNWTEGYYEFGTLVDLVLKEIHNTDQEHVIEASQPNIAVTFELKGVLKTPEDLPKEGSRGEVWKVGGTFYAWDEVSEVFTSTHGSLRGVNIQADGIGEGDISQTHYRGREIMIEVQAEKIYNEWVEMEGWVPWVKGGNSDMQFKARQEAKDKLEKFFADDETPDDKGETQNPKPFWDTSSHQLRGDFTNRPVNQLTEDLYNSWKAQKSPESDLRAISRTPEEMQWYKELGSFFTELDPFSEDRGGVWHISNVIENLIAKSTVSWEAFCEGLSYNQQTGEPLSISYELKLNNLYEFREEWRAGKFKLNEE